MTKARTLADNYAADINQVTATSPLTGGGTSGTVTVGIQAGTTSQSGAVQLTDSTASTSTTNAATPNSVKSAYDLANAAVAKSTIDAKGDLLVGTANDTVGRLAVASTAGYVLTVDSAETTGLKWAAVGSPTYVGCSVYRDTDLNVAHNTITAVNWNLEVFDTDAFHSTTTNTSRFTIPSGKDGKYLVNAQAVWDDNTTLSDRQISIRKNGATVKTSSINVGFYPTNIINAVIDAVATDYIEIAIFQNSGTTRTAYLNGTGSFAMVTYLGA